jgi:hypothetical protein
MLIIKLIYTLIFGLLTVSFLWWLIRDGIIAQTYESQPGTFALYAVAATICLAVTISPWFA